MRALLLLLQILAYLPTWNWYAARMSDGSDEPWGAAALLIALAFSWQKGRAAAPDPRGLAAGAACTLLYVAAAPLLSPLPLAGIAVCGLCCTVSSLRFGCTLHLGLFGLALLSLPLIATLQFFAGFPLRVLTAHCAAAIVSVLGYPAAADGSMLSYAGELVAVDAPCAGIKMLWSALVLHFSLAAFGGLNARATWVSYLLSSAAVFMANVLRASILFFIESGIVPAPNWAHTGVGLLVFSGLALSILLLHRRVGLGVRETPIRETAQPARLRQVQPAAICIHAACLALLISQASAAIDDSKSEGLPSTAAETAWPKQFEGEHLQRVALGAEERKFLRAFPGEVARFRFSAGELLLRRVTRPTRQLHPAGDCLRGVGYEVSPLPLRIDSEEQVWSCVLAEKEAKRLRVCEQIRAASGEYFSDVSMWFWSAALGQSKGPWLAVTTAEPW